MGQLNPVLTHLYNNNKWALFLQELEVGETYTIGVDTKMANVLRVSASRANRSQNEKRYSVDINSDTHIATISVSDVTE